MVEKDKVYEGKISQSGLFDFRDFYSFCYNWLVEEGYLVTEKKYSEKIVGNGKDIDIEWIALKKVSDYFRFSLSVKWKILGLNRVEIEKNGVKSKMDKANVEIKVGAILEKDYEHKWEDAPLMKFLRGVYDRYMIRARIDQYEAKLFSEANELIAQAKAFLSIEGTR